METEGAKKETDRGKNEISGNAEFLQKYSLPLFLLAVIAIVLIAVFFRSPMLSFYGFYEPDGYFHYAVIRAAVSNGFSIPQSLGISGWPPSCNSYTCGTPTPHHEGLGLYWVTLVPYFFLRFVGISYYDIMRVIPVIFGILDVLIVYFLARNWNRGKAFGLLVMLLVALNMGNAARTSALIYRGDSFVTPFLLAALVATIAIFKAENNRKRLIYTGLAALSLALCNLVWDGAPFATAVYIFAFVLILIFGFSFERKRMLRSSGYMLLALFAWYLLVEVFKALEWIVNVQTFTGSSFFLLFVPMAAGWYLIDRFGDSQIKHHVYFSTTMRRFCISIGIIIAAFAVIYAIVPSFVESIFVTNSFLISNAFSSTIQELQAPSYQFLFASFNFQNFTNPMSIIMIIATFVPGFTLLFWFIIMALFIPYLFMQIEDKEHGLTGGRAVWRFEFSETTLILISYFAITAYLQMNAIRFNSLLSIPISIFSAYTLYWLVLYLKRFRLAYYASFVLVFLLIAFVVQTDLGYISGLAPADQINPQFIQALAWMKNNTATNSVVLTLWPDGSVVEGVANRTSVTDSVGSQYAYKGNAFAAWLYNSSPDPGFLLRNITGKPDYLLVRQAWLLETAGIFTESGINITSNAYGYNPFTSVNEHVNSTAQVYQFFGNGYEEDTVITNNSTSGRSIASYLKFSNGIQPFGYIGFYNVITGNWSVIKQTAFNVTNNQTFLISYSPIPSPNLYVNITGAYMLSTALADSNMAKFLFYCDSLACQWDNGAASLQLVYINQDTKIFRIVYNESNATVAAANFPRAQ